MATKSCVPDGDETEVLLGTSWTAVIRRSASGSGPRTSSSQTPAMSAVQFQRRFGLTRYETAFANCARAWCGRTRTVSGRSEDHVEVDKARIGGGMRGERPGRPPEDLRRNKGRHKSGASRERTRKRQVGTFRWCEDLLILATLRLRFQGGTKELRFADGHPPTTGDKSNDIRRFDVRTQVRV